MKNSVKYLLKSWPANFLAVLIKMYQKTLSPDHGSFKLTGNYNHCRFFPSCSEYTLAAIRQYGLFRGAVVSLKRIARCNPLHPGGYDPL